VIYELFYDICDRQEQHQVDVLSHSRDNGDTVVLVWGSNDTAKSMGEAIFLF
jgi:hypothetical protein